MFSPFFRKKTQQLTGVMMLLSLACFSLVAADSVLPQDTILTEGAVDITTLFSGTTNSGMISTGVISLESVLIEHSDSNITNTGVISTGSTNSGVISSGNISTGILTSSGASGSVVVIPSIDYSTYSYYSGTFTLGGQTYGNSYYPNSLGLVVPKSVQVYSYDQYTNLQTTKLNQKQSKNTGIQTQSMMVSALSAPTNGLVAEYLFNSTGADTSGNNNHGTPTNVNWGSGPNGLNSVIFNGAGAITNSSPTGLARSTGQEITVNAWIKWAGGTGYQDIATIRGPNGHNWILYKHANLDKLSFHGGNNQFIGTYSIPVGQWIMTTAMVNSGGVSKMFVNGSLVDTITGYNFGTTYSNIFTIGAGSSTTEFFNGAISNVRIYNRAITSSEIQDLYNEGSATPVSNNTILPNSNSYLTSNPLASLDPRYIDQFKGQSNIAIQTNNSDVGKIEADNKNLADPVTLATGEFAYDNTLMSIPGIKLPYELKISYKNQATYNGPLGFNWDHSYNQYLSGETNGNILYSNGQLGIFRFIKSGGIWLRNEGLRATLVQSGATYQINYDNGNIAIFNSANRLSKTQDISGNALNFVYSGSYLSGVIDTLGRTISYSYYDHNRLRTVTDFTGRKVDFSYYTGSTASGNLYDLQSIVLTNSGVTKTISFEYSVSSIEPIIHNITKLIDAKGQTYVENTYTTDDRVATQKYGNGTLGYTYILSGSQVTKNSVIDKLGNRTDYTYDASGNNISTQYYNLSQSNSVTYTSTYNTLGLLATETRPRGNGYKYTYDTAGNLIEKRQKANMSLADSINDLVTTSMYNTRNEKMTETLPNNTQAIYTRDTTGNILTQTLSGVVNYLNSPITPVVTTNTYFSNGLIKDTTSPVGKLTKYGYTNGQLATLARGTGVETSTGSFIYSPYGTVLSATDGDGYTKNYGYTVFDLVSTGTTAEGIVTGYAYDANNNKTRETRYITGGTVNSYYYYDSLDHLTSSVVDIKAGQTVTTTYIYDNNGNVISKKIGNGATVQYTYNEFSKPTEERILLVPGNGSQDIVTSYTYDTNNNLVTKVDPRGYTTSYTYDLYDRLTRVTNPQGTYVDSIYNKDNTIDTTSTYTNTGLILTRNKTLYNNYGYKTQETNYLDPVNSTGAIVTKWLYNKDFEITIVTDPNNKNTINNFYDGRGNIYMVADGIGNSTQATYNKRDIKKISAIGQNNYAYTETNYLIDRDGRTTKSTNYLGKNTLYIYDNLGNIVKTTDEMGRVTDIERDYRGLMTKSTSYSGSTAIVTTYTYDERGNMTSILDPMNHTTSYQYDGINRNTKIVYPDLKEENLTYDKSSNLLTKTDPNGTTVTNTYDSLNHLTNRSISTGSGVAGVTNETYTYDPLGRLITGGDNTNNGSYSGAITNTLSFTYDALSRLTTETQKPIVGGTGYTIGYTYSSGSDLTRIVLPDGKIQTITYDNLRRPLVITYSGQTITTNVYTGVLLNKSTYGNTKITNYTYDTLNRLTNINHGSGFLSPTYTYNHSSDILSDGTKSYTYDTTKRLTKGTPTISGAILESYSYDKTGNRTNSTLSTGTTNYTTNTLDQYTTLSGSLSSTNTYTYNGNLRTEGNKTYTYDYNNRLIQVNIGTGILVKYSYDILGRRTQRVDYSRSSTNPESTIYLYNGDNIQSEYKTLPVGSGSLTLSKNYINSIGTDSLIAYDNEEQLTATGFTKTTNRYYYHLNQLGSVVALTSSTGTILQKYVYDSFGKAYIYSGTTLIPLSTYTGTTYSNTRLYTGREYDKEINLYHLRARYYNPETGKFISRDPVRQSDQVNLYTYVRNSPLMFTDRDGRKAKAATVTIYAERENGGLIQGHAWIELRIGKEVHTASLWPDAKDKSGNIVIFNGIQSDLDIHKKDTQYKNYSKISMVLSQEKTDILIKFVDESIANKTKWTLDYPCSAWASDAWNLVSENDLEDRNLFGFGISNPNTLSDSIIKENLK